MEPPTPKLVFPPLPPEDAANHHPPIHHIGSPAVVVYPIVVVGLGLSITTAEEDTTIGEVLQVGNHRGVEGCTMPMVPGEDGGTRPKVLSLTQYRLPLLSNQRPEVLRRTAHLKDRDK